MVPHDSLNALPNPGAELRFELRVRISFAVQQSLLAFDKQTDGPKKFAIRSLENLKLAQSLLKRIDG